MVDAIPRPSFGPTGFIIPPEADVLVAVKAAWNAAFGGNLNMADETPQGQLCVSETASIGNANDSFVFLSQQMDPAYNIGRYQDAIARIYFIERFASRPTVVTVTCIGGEGVVIPANAIVVAQDGTQYIATDGGTIPESGTIDLQFECIIPGPIACPAGSIQSIYQAINGWDQAFNAADGAIGRFTEGRAEFEDRRRLSVAHNAQGSLPSVRGSVLSVPDVLDAYVAENVNNSPLTIRGFTLNPNSIYVAAVGGDDDDVARALWTKKSPGCGYNGNTAVTVEDTSDVYSPPYPSYEVRFERPEAVTITFAVTLVNNPSVPANVATLVSAAIVLAFSGADGGERARIGSTIYASRFYAPIAALGTWAQIINVKLGSTNSSSSSFTADIADTTMTVSAISGGTIAVGQQVVGDGVVPGTFITAGGGMSWTLSTVQTVASTSMKGITASSDEVVIDIDQQPVTAPGNVSVTLI